jgi:hypothetical protein
MQSSSVRSQAWDKIESISPYTTSMHWNRANKAVNPGGGSGVF